MQAAANIVQWQLGKLPTVVQPEYKYHVRVIDAPIPNITEPDDVIVKVTGTTICGSDLHLYRGEIMGLQKGDILGHEFMGVVDRIGPNIKNLTIGQRVVASFQVACGKCRYCKEGLSSFSEYVRVPLGEVNLLPIPNGVSDEEALYPSDVLPISYHCVVDTGVQEGDTSHWTICARWENLKGASRVIATDKIPERLERVKEQGCEVNDFSKVKDVSQRVHEMVPGGLDVALDCGTFHKPKTLLLKGMKMLMLETDVPETANEMIASVRKMGRCGHMLKGVRFIGNGQAPVHKYWRKILYDYIMTGKFDPTFMISHCVPLEDMAKLYPAFDNHVGSVEKVFVETQFSPPSDGAPKLSRADDWAH
ncbi:GroES-like protein [Suillus weaverae]|nr:GroES-like protein [Suillus weaverae]